MKAIGLNFKKKKMKPPDSFLKGFKEDCDELDDKKSKNKIKFKPKSILRKGSQTRRGRKNIKNN